MGVAVSEGGRRLVDLVLGTPFDCGSRAAADVW